MEKRALTTLFTFAICLAVSPLLAQPSPTQPPVTSATSPSANSPPMVAAPPRIAPQMIQVPAQELYALQKLQIQRELEETIVKWMQTRFWFIAIISLFVGYFGVRALVREFVSSDIKEAMRASADAQAAASLARDSIKEVRAEAGKYKEHVDSASETASQVNNKLLELRSRIEAEGDRSVAAAEIKIQGLEQQIGELKSMLNTLAASSSSRVPQLQDVDLRLERMKAEAHIKEVEFSDNANVKVCIVGQKEGSGAEQVKQLRGLLTNNGYRIGLSPWGEPIKAKGKIRIAFMPNFERQANTIADLIREKIGNEFHGEVELHKQSRPISNSDDQVVIFFE